MTQLSQDCFVHGGELMRLEEGLDLIKSRLEVACAIEYVEVAEARGRILACDVKANGSVPPHTNSAVDGYAVYHSDLNSKGETELKVQG